MGSYENIVKIEEMRRKTEEGDYASAQKILDTIERKKIKNITDLSLMAEVFTQNERYEEALELLLKIYSKAKTRKTIYQLVWVSIKRNSAEDAETYLAEYEKVAPQDFYQYVFRYKIDKLNGEPFEKLIEILETLKKIEYIEQWAYELAKLYYKAGLEEECIRECSDIVLWFGEGMYVEKAKMLKAYYSGETDKDGMIEKLKRIAFEERTGYELNHREGSQESLEKEEALINSEQDQLEGNDINIDYKKENYIHSKTDLGKEDYINVGEDQEEEFFTTSEFAVEDEIIDFADDLKRDVEGILTGDLEEDMEGYPEEVENNNQEDTTYQQKSYNPDLSESDLEEQEVEQTIFGLLQDEDLDEEDKKLKQMSSELGLDLEEIFENFLHVRSIKKQLVKSLEIILNESTKSIQMIITGTANSGKTTLAKDFASFFNQIGRLESSKVAKIKAEKLNAIDIMEKKETLRDCCLIIENASDLKRDTIDKLIELIQYFHGDIVVIFEENKKNMNMLFRECPKLMDLFKNRIHLPQYTTEELVGFAFSCLKQQDYLLNPKAKTVLQNKIYQITKKTEPSNQLNAAILLVQTAMDAADVRTGKLLPGLAAQGRLKDVEILTILPEDFNARL